MNWQYYIGLLLILFLLGCMHQNEEDRTIIKEEQHFHLNIDSIGFIKVVGEGKEYRIGDREKIEMIISLIEDSEIEYVKFGSSNIFTIYNLNDGEVLEGFFRGNTFKIKGVVYKAKRNLF